jgi:3-deoxy-D-manno-octulosonic-acid transferase
VPAFLINGRISDKSFARHQRFLKLSRHVLGHFQQIAAGSEEDARRFRTLGFASTLTGNIKFDVASDAPMSAEERRARLRADLGFGADPRTVVLLGSSTWKGEEALLLRIVRELRAAGQDVRLLLVRATPNAAPKSPRKSAPAASTGTSAPRRPRPRRPAPSCTSPTPPANCAASPARRTSPSAARASLRMRAARRPSKAPPPASPRCTGRA